MREFSSAAPTWTIVNELVEENPYLVVYGSDPHKYAFPLQIFMLNARHTAYRKAVESGKSTVFERSVFDDIVFAEANHDMGYIDDRDIATYRTLYTETTHDLPVPDLAVLIDVKIDVTMGRVRSRGRECELKHQPQYYDQLHVQYEKILHDLEARGTDIMRVDWNDEYSASLIEIAARAVADAAVTRAKTDVAFPLLARREQKAPPQIDRLLSPPPQPKEPKARIASSPHPQLVSDSAPSPGAEIDRVNAEIKARVRDPSKLSLDDSRLGTFEAVLRQTDVYFANESNGRRLKLREEQRNEETSKTSWLIAYERPNMPGCRMSRYSKIPVDQFTAEMLLNSHNALVVVRKVRRLYRRGVTRVHLDNVGGKYFIELEVQGNATTEEKKQIAQTIMDDLDIIRDDLIEGSYADM